MFNLTRYFSTLSFALIALAAGLLTFYFRHITYEQLLRHEQNRAEEFTQVFENSLWPLFKPVMENAQTDTPDVLQERVANVRLRETLSNMTRGTSVIRINIYTRNGISTFSTDPRQVGDSKRDNPGFLSAVNGTPISELTHRNQFATFEDTLQDRDVISTYVPIHSTEKGQERIDGVFEVYQDVTAFVQEADQHLKWVSAGVAGVLAALYLAQFMLVRHAQIILRAQARALEATNHDLDRRVQERTHDLENEISERRRAELRLDYLAHHDPLTDLPNRLLFKERLSQSLQRIRQHHTQLAVLFIDLDHFKDVNDTLGHSIGDTLLTIITRRLQACIRPGDTLARIGGDEFICILENTGGPATALEVADQLLELFRQPFTVDDKQLYLSASVGISQAPIDGMEVDVLVRKADAAMYQAKADGRNRSHFYTNAMTAYAQERIQLEGLLRDAITSNELSVHFQPKVDVKSGRLLGAEALLRWDSRELGLIPPTRFIPLAEETGFIMELGFWILCETCRQIALWDEAGLHVPVVSINLSVKQLERGNLPELLRTIMRETGITPERLELEITESVIMAMEDAFAMLADLRALGVRLALDDFGTGYSSLSYLRKLPVQTLKIDQGFIAGIGKNRSDEAIVQAMVDISRSLNLSSVAEGVETAEQFAFLRRLGCEQVQGFLFGKPVSASEFQAHWQAQAVVDTVAG
ncbi:putative bifunctional diguanylate cyclase/phosphodiesterase [Curvibacter delicatus]|uniref:putative bifunctional diguanylate cyclase/phosphodiesterase n=1 Tax=Curvibacter delicatus TaxID=80879 RepID=UPI00083141DD|nr:EAL domain-containing protein [Curvibacter delicatus]